ncbi:hypothetical protein FGE12_23630 [Aggregicoccus sp. 17bor-14]|uniref:hypothetical protein n=1 Tax=Myxococcaceae TaxID=31 RepID=UPI00129C19D8|nr:MULTISPECIES: hypothetical protein [Myxococcaceae]MBF5045417.1 hypothetical protein [Simulacricoccus sp. 17bor-14]MRI91158.1 hypothetical protein [Aggregicoccus sp. 17bor-14]
MADAECAPTVKLAEAIPEPEGGWEAVSRPSAAYQPPADDAPFGLTEPAACVPSDGRPSLASWCERALYYNDGVLIERTTRSATGTHWTQTHGCSPSEPCTHPPNELQYDPQERPLERSYWDWGRDSVIHELWQWSPDGLLETFLEESSHLGAVGHTRWQLHRACDGRPAHYEVSYPDSPSRPVERRELTYDARGHRTLELTPLRSVARAWDASGHLRAEEEAILTSNTTTSTRRYFDAAGAELASLYTFSGNMGEATTWTWDERDAQGRVAVRRQLHTYSGNTSYLTRFAYDPEGRQALAWTTARNASGGLRQAQRWTYACGAPDPVRLETSSSVDGSVGEVTTWTWDPLTRTIAERQANSYYWTQYRFDCTP